MIRFIDLTEQYFCNNGVEEALPPCWAFIDTTSDKFLTTDDGSHLFDMDDIDMHPQAGRLRRLLPEGEQ
jgi:hypothetical protein